MMWATILFMMQAGTWGAILQPAPLPPSLVAFGFFFFFFQACVMNQTSCYLKSRKSALWIRQGQRIAAQVSEFVFVLPSVCICCVFSSSVDISDELVSAGGAHVALQDMEKHVIVICLFCSWLGGLNTSCTAAPAPFSSRNYSLYLLSLRSGPTAEQVAVYPMPSIWLYWSGQ